jgi:hypothetical protein
LKAVDLEKRGRADAVQDLQLWAAGQVEIFSRPLKYSKSVRIHLYSG